VSAWNVLSYGFDRIARAERGVRECWVLKTKWRVVGRERGTWTRSVEWTSLGTLIAC